MDCIAVRARRCIERVLKDERVPETSSKLGSSALAIAFSGQSDTHLSFQGIAVENTILGLVWYARQAHKLRHLDYQSVSLSQSESGRRLTCGAHKYQMRLRLVLVVQVQS